MEKLVTVKRGLDWPCSLLCPSRFFSFTRIDNHSSSGATSNGVSTFFLPFFKFIFLFPQVGGGGDGSQGQIEIFSLNRPIPRAVKSLLVGSAVRCLEYVPELSSNEEAEGQKAPSGPGAHICVGLDDGR